MHTNPLEFAIIIPASKSIRSVGGDGGGATRSAIVSRALVHAHTYYTATTHLRGMVTKKCPQHIMFAVVARHTRARAAPHSAFSICRGILFGRFGSATAHWLRWRRG